MKTRITNLVLLPALVIWLGGGLAGRVTAQTFTPLYSLNGVSDGSGPGALVLSGNMLYGTTSSGGSSNAGTIFRVGTNGLNYTVLYSFTNGSDGNFPGGLILSGNTLYGTVRGSTVALPYGALFSISTSGSGFTNFYNFTNGSDGRYPSALILVSNVLYGTTANTFFQVNPDGSGFTSLHSFGSAFDGAGPSGALLLAGNTLYGTTTYGGPGNDGTIYSYNLSSSFYTNFYQFAGINDLNPVNSTGAYPLGGLVLSGNTLYGTAQTGGSLAEGTLFAVNTDGSGFTNLFNFGGWFGTYPDYVYLGISPNGSLILSNNILYGTSVAGGVSSFQGGSGSYGTIFSITTNGTSYLNLHIFPAVAGANSTNSDGAYPRAGLVPVGNSFYGTAGSGGTAGFGTLFNFSLTPVPVVITTTSLPPATAGSVYNLYFMASGGQPPYAWTNIAGTFPPNMSPLEGNYLWGYPNHVGTYNFTMQVTDAYGVTATHALSLVVTNPDVLTLTITNATAGMVVSNVSPIFQLQGTVVEVGPPSSEYVYDVYYSVNNSAWLSAGSPANSSWSASVGLVPGNNTIAVYALDSFGSVSATNTVTLRYVVPPASLVSHVPGTPVSTNWNNGGNPMLISEGGGFGVLPITATVSGAGFVSGASFTAVAGDVVFLLDPAGGNGRANWAAVVRFFNPADPTGTLGLAATEYNTFYQTNAGASYFSGFTLFPRVLYVPIARTVTFPRPGIVATYDEIGPVDGIFSGQLAAITIGAQVQPSGFTATIAVPFAGENIGGNGSFTVLGVTTTTNTQAAVTNVYVQLNGGNWFSATTTNAWTNWTANVILSSGNNTVAAYAVDHNGNLSATNSVTFNYLGGDPADLSLTASAAPEPVAAGSNLVYSLLVSNAGPGSASVVVLSNQLPANVTFVSASDGSTASNGVWVTSFGLNAGATNLLQLVVRPTAAGMLTNLFQVAGLYEPDLVPSNNSATVVSTVTSGVVASADVSLTAIAVPASELVPSNLVYFITVSNAGPSTATDVVVSNQLSTNVTFISATTGASPTNGVLLLNLGSLAPDATNLVQIVVLPNYVPNSIINAAIADVTNVFQVSADQFDPDLSNNSATVATNLDYSGQVLNITSEAEYDTNNTTIVNQQTTNYSTEIIAKMPNGTVVYDQTFNVTYLNATVQSAITTAAGDLNGAGATSYAGPTQTSFLQTTNSVSVTVTNSTSTNYIVGTKEFIGPVTNLTGNFGVISGYTLVVSSPGMTNYAIPTSWNGNPLPSILLPGQIEYDTRVLSLMTNLLTTTNTATYTNSSVYVMTGIVSQASADVSLRVTEAPNPVIEAVSNLVTFTLIVSNAGPATATDVTVSNQISAYTSPFFVSATGGYTPTNGILLINLGSLAPGATNMAQITATVSQAANIFYTNSFGVFADQPDPNPTNNSATVTFEAFGNQSEFSTTSSAEYYSNVTTTVSQQLTNYTTELIAKLPNGTVVYDQKFTVAYSDAAVQTAIATAALDLTNAGASAYTGPAQTGFSQTTNIASVTVPISTNSTVIEDTKAWVGPATFPVGNYGIVTGYSFDDPIDPNYPVCTGGTPSSFTLTAGQTDYDSMILAIFTIFQTTTNTSTYTNSSVYVMTGIVSQASADVSISGYAGPQSGIFSSNLVYYLTVSNAGPATAAGVVVSNQIPAGVVFISATGGATPTNGNLLLNLGSLAPGASDVFQVAVQLSEPIGTNAITNIFEVFANQTDPNLANNATNPVVNFLNGSNVGFSYAEYDTNVSTTVNQQSNVYSTELVAKLPNGTVVYDQTFSLPYSNSTVQAAITTAAGNLTGAGAASYTGPTQASLLQATNNVSVTITNSSTNQISGTKLFVGPVTFLDGNFGQIQSYTFDSTITNFALPAGWNGSPLAETLNSGAVDIVTIFLNLVTNLTTTTNRVTYTDSAVYVMTGNVAQASADLSLRASVAPEPVGVGSNLVYSLTVSNAGPSAASGVIVSNQLPAGVNFVSATGGATPSGGVLLVNLGSLALGATNLAQIIVQPTVAGKLTNLFRVFASQTDPVPTNNSATVVSTVTNPPPGLVPFPGTPISWGAVAQSLPVPYTGEDGYPISIATYMNERNALFGDMYGAFTDAVPGDVVLLLDINGGHSRTNWAAVFKFFNPADPNGTNGQPATYFEPFLASNSVSNGFAGFKLFTNILYLQGVTGTMLHGESELGLTNEVGPLEGLAAGQSADFAYLALPRTICTITSPVSGQQVSNLIFTVTGTATTFSGQSVTNVTYRLNGGAWTTATAANGWTNWSATVTLTPGSNTVQAFAVDTDGIPSATNAVTFDYVPVVDVALSLIAAPNPVSVGLPLTYSLTVTNNSANTATGVVVSNTLPANVTFISALPSQGSATNKSGVVTYFVGALPTGDDATLAIVVIPNAAGLLTDKAIAISAQTDSQPANNRATNVTIAVGVAATNLSLTVISPITLNLQTGLFEERVRVFNGGPGTPSWVRVLVSGLAGNTRLWNASGKTNGVPYVQSNAPLGVGASVDLVLKYYVSTRVLARNFTLTAQGGPAALAGAVAAAAASINHTTLRSGGRAKFEFGAVPGQIYAVQYSRDLVTWRTALPAMSAATNLVQWSDAGPPMTDSNPNQQRARYYRVVLLPGN